MALPTPADRRPLPSSTRAAAAHPGTSTGRAPAVPPCERWRRPVLPPWPRWGLWPLALAIATALPPAVTYAFTQSGAGVVLGNGIPMGHEWLTRLAALELTGGDPIMPADPQDPRRNWTQGRAKNLDLSGASTQAELARLRALPYPDQRYQSTYQFVFDAIPLAKNPIVYTTDRAEEFSPVKNAEGTDSPATSKRDQTRRAARWLSAAGVRVPMKDGEPDCVIELSPLYATSEAELVAKRPIFAIAPGQKIYVDADGKPQID